MAYAVAGGLGAALAVMPLVLLLIRDFPSDIGITAYGAGPDSRARVRTELRGGPTRAVTVLSRVALKPQFWLLAGGFAVYGASTNGLVGSYFVSATHGIPPTVALCRRHFGDDGPVAFGWVVASHQIGAALAATGAGIIRDVRGSYDLAWYIAGALCAIAMPMSGFIGSRAQPSIE